MHYYGFQGALLVNIARGGLLDYNAVLHHLESGHLGGLGIDVAWTEPFDPDDAILNFPNVIITPHVAGVTEYSYRYMAKVWTYLNSLRHSWNTVLIYLSPQVTLVVQTFIYLFLLELIHRQ